jgi:lysophospholipase L1-like esterase
LLIGVNNQYRGRDAEKYRVEFAGLLERAIAYAGNTPARVIVLSIPDWGVTPFARGRQNVSAAIDAYNKINRAETIARGARHLDITPASRRAQFDATLLARDGLHPSAKMYAEWVQALAPLAREISESFRP